MGRRSFAGLLALMSLLSLFLGLTARAATGPTEPPLVATPQGECGPGSNPEEGLQGRVPPEDYASGRAAEGYSCNAERVGGYIDSAPTAVDGTFGGFKVHRFVDAGGRECAYYDTTLLLGSSLLDLGVGVNVLDMADPANPQLTATLSTFAMDSPHESLVLSQARGLLVAVGGSPATSAGVVDIYDVNDDCRTPTLRSSTPIAIVGHESGLSADGNTFYVGSPVTQSLLPVDISNPDVPVPMVTSTLNIDSHGLSLNDDGTRAYVGATQTGLVILDTSAVQAREPNAKITEISRLDWTSRSIPQNAVPFTSGGIPYVMEIDEFGGGSAVGAGRIIDISDETTPTVVSNLRLEVHQPEHFATIGADPGTQNPIQGYAGHYCNIPTAIDPAIVACSMINSGLRIFDITDPRAPVEVAYFNVPAPADGGATQGSYAMSSPTFVPERSEVWYSDGHTGFHVIRLTNDVWPAQVDNNGSANGSGNGSANSTTTTTTLGSSSTTAAVGGTTLPATGGDPTLFWMVAALSGAAAAGSLLVRRRI